MPTAPRRRAALASPLALVTLLSLGVSGFDARAADEPPPDLQGVWAKIQGEVVYWNDEINIFPHSYDVAEVDIFHQEGGVFRASQRTVPKAEAHVGRHGPEPLSSDGTPMLGAIGYDNLTVRLADIDDTTVYVCTLLDPDTMSCMVHEAGTHALAGRLLLSRKP